MKLKTPSVLAFARRLEPSDALFFSCLWDEKDSEQNWEPVSLKTEKVRGVIGNRSTGDSDTKLANSLTNSNIQRVDTAHVPSQHDSLAVQFTLKVLGNIAVPSACSSTAYLTKLKDVIGAYIDETQLSELGLRYATNLANGRFLWRNRIGAESIHVRVERIKNGSPAECWEFSGLDVPIRDFSSPSAKLQSLGDAIASGLATDEYTFFSVTAIARVGSGQEVFPSQEFIEENNKKEKSKTLYHVDGTAGMHSRKVGNAIRTVDDWHPESAAYGPISVEPYGTVTLLGAVFRTKRAKQDFYNLIDGWVLKDGSLSLEEKHYVVAMLIRGGVFGESDKK